MSDEQRTNLTAAIQEHRAACELAQAKHPARPILESHRQAAAILAAAQFDSPIARLFRVMLGDYSTEEDV